jgi:hypothetical protein
MNKLYSAVLAVLIIAAAATTTTQATYALLVLEPPSILINGPPVNFTADNEDIDIAIDPTDPLPANGTMTISTAGATDSDMNGFPPLGVSVIIQNDTVTVTNQPVTVGVPAAAAADDSSSGGDEGDSSSND